MALRAAGKSAGKTGGGFETDAVEAEIFGAGVDIWNAPDVALFLLQQHPAPNKERLTGFWRMLDLVCRRFCQAGQRINFPS